MFREFLTSGYTRVDEMIRTRGWKLQIHQVIRPMMAPFRFFYDENLSQMPNISKSDLGPSDRTSAGFGS